MNHEAVAAGTIMVLLGFVGAYSLTWFVAIMIGSSVGGFIGYKAVKTLKGGSAE